MNPHRTADGRRRGVVAPVLQLDNESQQPCERCGRQTGARYRLHPGEPWRCMGCMLAKLNSRGKEIAE